jgi:hypothetical protein|tara:strand:- start:50849 stop:51073 length:225 start_codon:yes stop_codon:yes gene_type:complete
MVWAIMLITASCSNYLSSKVQKDVDVTAMTTGFNYCKPSIKNAGTCVTQHLFKQHKEIIALWLLGETRWEGLFA